MQRRSAESHSRSVDPNPQIPPPTHDEIALRAYGLYELRGFEEGRAIDDWLEAERQLAAERDQEVVGV